MATLPGFDRAAITERVLAITRGLLLELGNTAAAEVVTISASLERDLGLGSIERVELVSRIERTLRTSLPEGAITEANTVADVVDAVAEQLAGEASTAGELADFQPAPGGALNDTPAGVEIPRASDGSGSTAEAPAYSPSRGPRRIWEIIYGVYAAGVFLIWLVLTWVVVLMMPPGQAAARVTSTALRIYFKVIGCRIRLTGREHLDAYGASIYVSNHMSYTDVLVIMALFHTDYHFVAKSEVNTMPFIGTFLRKLGHFSFDRGKLRARSQQAEQMEKSLLRGESVYVFAEGTFTPHPGVRPFQLGAFRAAVKTGRPIIPVALRGTRQLLRDGTFLPKPARIDVIISPALVPTVEEPGREWSEVLRLREETRRIISAHSGEPMLASAGGPNAFEASPPA